MRRREPPGPAAAQGGAPRPPTFAGTHQPLPLRFDHAKLSGVSKRLITSYWKNNYQGSVQALNTVEEKLAAAIADKDFPPLVR